MMAPKGGRQVERLNCSAITLQNCWCQAQFGFPPEADQVSGKSNFSLLHKKTYCIQKIQ